MGAIRDLFSYTKLKLQNANLREKRQNSWLEAAMTVTAPAQFGNRSALADRAATMIEREDTNLATAVRVITSAAAWLPFHVKQQAYDDQGKESWISMPDHPFHDLWRRPNWYHTTAELKTHLFGSALLTGKAYVGITGEVETLTGRNRNTELWPLPAYLVKPKIDRDTGKPTAYIQNLGNGKIIEWPLEQMIHVRLYNVNDPVEGRSHTEPLRRQLYTEYQAELMQLAFFTNDGTPRSVLMPEVSMTPEQEAQAEQFFATRANPDDKHRLQIMPVAGKIQNVTPSQTDMEFQDMRRYHRERTFGLIGIPPFLGGVMEYANYANARVQEESFWRNTMIPNLNLVCDFLTRQLLERLWPEEGERIKVEADTSDVEALQGDHVKKAKKVTMLVKDGVFTPNEGRAEYGKAPIETDEADELRKPGTMPDMTGGNGDGDGDGDGLGKIPTEITVITRSARGRILQTKTLSAERFVERWKAFDSMVQANEKKIEAALRKFYRGQHQRVQKALQDKTVEGLMMSHLALARTTKAPSDLDWLMDMGLENETLELLIGPLVIQIMDAIGGAEADTAKLRTAATIGWDFDVGNPEVDQVIAKLTNRIVGTNNTTFREIKRILRRGFDERMAIDEIARLIRDKFHQYGTVRSKRIARTEMTGIANAASQIAWKKNGATHKTWIATLDPKTRDAHVQYNGERVAINDVFKFGPEPIEHPGDTSASPENTINCRCTLEYDMDPLTEEEIQDLEIQGLEIPGQAA